MKARWFAALFLGFALAEGSPLVAADSAERLIAAAKKEGNEIVFVAAAQTYKNRTH